jgi:hypothetical protein
MERTSVGARVGIAVGFCGWLIGLAAVAWATGESGILGQVAGPGLALSLGAAACVLATLEVATRAALRGRVFRLLMWGEILFFVGLLLLIVSHWVAPLIDAAPRLRDAVVRLGSVYRTPDLLSAALMAAGTVLLGLALRGLRRTA